MHIHAAELLKKPCREKVPPIVIMMGKERFFKIEVMKWLKSGLFGEESEDSFEIVFKGKGLEYVELSDELHLISMWQKIKLVLVEDADELVTACRAHLEKYFQAPAKKSVLVLDVTTWAASTRLAKIVKETGWTIECQELAGAKLAQWVKDWAQLNYNKQISNSVAQHMIDLAGNSIGVLEREIAKLADYLGDRNQITDKDVDLLVGGWKTETTWTMLNAVRDQDPGVALNLLHQLLKHGEPPMKLLGGINFVFRKYAEATQRVYQGENLNAAMSYAKIFPAEIESGSRYLKRLGRERASEIMKLLHDANLNFKGGSQLPEQIQIEKLLLELGGIFK